MGHSLTIVRNPSPASLTDVRSAPSPQKGRGEEKSGLTLFYGRIIFQELCSLGASSRDVSEMEQSAAPAGRGRNVPPRIRAAPGLRPGPLWVPARSWLMAGR